jgi:hypothetical protein
MIFGSPGRSSSSKAPHRPVVVTQDGAQQLRIRAITTSASSARPPRPEQCQSGFKQTTSNVAEMPRNCVRKMAASSRCRVGWGTLIRNCGTLAHYGGPCARPFQDRLRWIVEAILLKIADLRRVGVEGERSSGRTARPLTDRVQPELRCWCILPSLSRARQRSMVSCPIPTFGGAWRRPLWTVLSCWDGLPGSPTGAVSRGGITLLRWC